MKPCLRRGYTLVEVLVVTAILTSLLGLVVSGARTPRRDGDIRRGAQQLASILLASQSLSLGSPTGAAAIIDPEGLLGETVSHARRFPFIEGTVERGMPPADPSAMVQTVRLKPMNDDVYALEHGYKIRFLDRSGDTDGPQSDWFSLASPLLPRPRVVPAPSYVDAVVRLRSENGQTSRTALWPTAPTSGTLSFQAARYPIPAGLSQALNAGVAIDLRHSGYGDDGLTDWASFSGKGAIAVGFDPVGSVDSLMQNVLPQDGMARTVQPITPNEPIYFLVTLRSEIVDPAVNALASAKALWVVLHHRTGRVTIAPNVPYKNIDANSTDEAAWAKARSEARAKARQGISIGG